MNAFRATLLVAIAATGISVPVSHLDGTDRSPGVPGGPCAGAKPSGRWTRSAVQAPSGRALGTRGTDGNWLSRVERHLAAKEYEASRTGSRLQAPNRAHDLRTYFEPTGIRVVDRVAEGSPALLSLRLRDWGHAGRIMPVGPGDLTSAGSRVEIRRRGLLEWYENSVAGLEQGFTLQAPPAGEGPVLLELSLDEARISLEKGALALTSPTGRRLLYGGLAAWDAAGRSLPARLEVEEPGVVRIAVEDAGACYPVTVDPLLTVATTLQSDQASAQLGVSVAGAGDVNGDGYADLIVGAPYYDAGQANEGAAFVFLGSAAGVANGNPLTAAATLQSDQANAFLGHSVAGAGDVNGDGYADVIVGAANYTAAQAQEGAAFVFLGSAAGVVSGNPATAAATLRSDQANAFMGMSVAGAGDVNGDGYADVIVGAYAYDAGQIDEGAAFIFPGSASGVANGTPATAAARLEANQVSTQMGASVAGAGDVNGDGYADVIVGAPYYDAGQSDEGAAFVFLGSAAGVANGNPSTASAILQADQASACLGTSVAGAGDVNGDGYSDVIVGAYFYDAGETNEGAAFVFTGSASGVANGTPATASAMLQSNQASAFMGSSVAGAGDVNGDGYADVVVGANSFDAGEADEGAVFLLLGGASGIVGGGPTAATAILQSDQIGALLGASVAGAGDVNGDGYADVIAGASGYRAGETDEGAAFVYLGSAGGVVSGVPATASATLQSDQSSAWLGMSVAGAGDVNGDGFADVIVGAPGYDSGQADEGAAFVFLGSAAGVMSGNPATAATLLQSDQASAEFGRGVGGAGDVNGDGYADVVVGAPSYNAGQAYEGAAFVFLGSPAGVASGTPATAAATLQSDQVNANLGFSVAGAGDVNGDGYADVIVGSYLYSAGQTSEGAAFVFLGSPSGIASGNPASASATLQSNQANASLGISVAGAGDVNGDGYADLIVGAQYYDAGEVDEGTAFIFQGGPTGVMSGDPTTAATVLQSNQSGANLGYGVAGAGDVNRDGYADVIVGARGYDSGQTDEGAAFVFLGSAAGVPSGGPGSAAAMLQADQAGASLGFSVAGAGDVNGDGYADVIVGAPYYDSGQTDEGATFVFLGGAAGLASGTPMTAAATFQSDQMAVHLGQSVAGAGDVNGDGFADVIVGTQYYAAGQPSEGAAFVLLGGGGTKGRPVLARQGRADLSGIPVQAWGGTYVDRTLRLGMRGTDPQGRGKVKLQAQYCPPGIPFGGPGCGDYVSPVWHDVTATAGGLSLEETIASLPSNTLYRWRVRLLHAPFSVDRPGITSSPNPAHGPWRRLSGQAVEADVRTGPAGVGVAPTPPDPSFAIQSVRPNPAMGPFAVTFVLPGSGPAKLEMFDVAGRQVLAREFTSGEGGRQTMVFHEGRAVSSGIYLVRLSHAGRAVSARIVMLH